MQILTESNHQQILESKETSAIMYSTPFCAPCRGLKPAFEGIAALFPGVSFYTVDLTKVQLEIEAVPLFRVVAASEILYEGLGAAGFDGMRVFLEK